MNNHDGQGSAGRCNATRRRGILFVISAPSGAGKTTLCAEAMKIFPEINLSVSCTTRNKRRGEIDGKDYHFINRDDFRKMIEAGAFAEWAEVHGELYGTTVETLKTAEAEGKDLILDIDWQGAKQIKESLKRGVYIFILPPSLAELKKRLEERGKDTQEVIARRLNNAREEIEHAPLYDYNIINDDLDESVLSLKSIIVAERCRPGVQVKH